MRINEYINKIINSIYDIIDKNKKTVAFVSYLPNYRNQVGSLHKIFKKNGFNVINIVNQILNDRFEKQAPTFVIPKEIDTGKEKIILDVNIDFIDLMIFPDREHIIIGEFNRNFLSKRAKKLYLPHDILDGIVFDYVDYNLMPSKSSMEIWINRNYKMKNFALIPLGYPKLDYSIEKFNLYKRKSKLKEDSIIYAPTIKMLVENFNPGAAVSAVGFDCMIIQTLLDNFDEYIIYRPHPHNVNFKHYNIALIHEKFKNNKRVILNFSQNYLEYYVRAKFMLTDLSDTAYTFSFSTLKPSIFLVHSNINKLSLKQEYYTKIGYKTNSITEAIKLGKSILKNKKNFSNKIENLRNDFIFNVGKSGYYLLDNLEYILHERYHPEWSYIN